MVPARLPSAAQRLGAVAIGTRGAPASYSHRAQRRCMRRRGVRRRSPADALEVAYDARCRAEGISGRGFDVLVAAEDIQRVIRVLDPGQPVVVLFPERCLDPVLPLVADEVQVYTTRGVIGYL